MNIHIPAQRSAPDEAAVVAASAPVAEPGWGRVLRTAAARASLAMVLSLVIWSILPLLVGMTPRVILSGSMEPRIHSGDVIATHEVEAADLTKGQVITTIDPDSPEKTRTHRVLERDSAGKIVTKGDANREPDSSPVTNDAVLGLGVLRVPYVGRPAYWMAEHNWLALAATSLFLSWAAVTALPGRKRNDSSDDDLDGPSGDADPETDPGHEDVTPSRTRSHRRRRVGATVAAAVVAVGALGGPADAAFKFATANPASILNAASTFYPYKTAVLGDSPSFYWRLDEASGTAVDDAGSGNRDGTLLAQTFTRGQAGALASEPRSKSLSVSVGVVNGNTFTATPGTFSVEAWVKTTSTTGGRILGFGNATGQNASTTVDRQLYLAPNGKVMFGVGGTKKALASSSAVNDGAWHHVVGTYGSGSMRLYVDGALQGSPTTATPVSMNGYWRAGAEQLTGWPSNPTDFYYEGSLDELAVYPSALTATKVAAHYNAGVGG